MNTEPDRWIVVGSWRRPHYEPAIADALTRSGKSVHRFSIRDYIPQGYVGRFQNKYIVGPAIRRINEGLQEFAEAVQPHVIFFRKPTHIWGSTIPILKDLACRPVIVTSNNDNPFDDGCRRTLWRHYHEVAAHADVNFFFRPKDRKQAKSLGWKMPEVLPPYYLPDEAGPRCEVGFGRQTADQDELIGFYGHYEPDGRERYLEELLAADLPVRVIGPRWKELRKTTRVGKAAESRWIPRQSYYQYLRSTLICLCFLSKRNRDVYTRRCFEIPAAGSVLLSERTTELQSLFEENVEAVYFSTAEELVSKARWLLQNPDIANEIARRGQQRCLADGHDVDSRVRFIIDRVNRFK